MAAKVDSAAWMREQTTQELEHLRDSARSAAGHARGHDASVVRWAKNYVRRIDGVLLERGVVGLPSTS